MKINKKHLIILCLMLVARFAAGRDANELMPANTGPPQVRIIQPIDGSVFGGGQVRVDYVVMDAAPWSVRVLVDGHAEQLLPVAATGQYSVTVDVPPRNCRITVVARNGEGEGTAAEVYLQRSEALFKPSLYLLAIGVSNYEQEDIRLRFPAKDAIDFAQAMLRQDGLLYEDVELRMLTDGEATAENIRDGLEWLKTETTTRDVAMLYMAGHGVNNNVGDFFFMPVGGDMERMTATCVSYADIRSTIAGTPGKTVVFMDACHSGNVLGNHQRRAAVISDAVYDLAKSDNGTVVFTSSTGRQFSLENAEWGNGAFTKALVEGMNGGADLFQRNVVTVKSLDSFIANRVKELTRGQQSPTTIIPTGITDYPLAIVSAASAKTAGSESAQPAQGRTRVREKVQPVPNHDAALKALSGQEVGLVAPMNYYISATAGITKYGSCTPGVIDNGGAATYGVEGAYFFGRHIGAGVKLNMSVCGVSLTGTRHWLSWHDRVMFAGPALYTQWGTGKIVITGSAGIGALQWKMSNLTSDDDDDYMLRELKSTAAGGFAQAGIHYMFSNRMGIALNVQSAFGSMKSAGGMKRNPAGLGASLGLVYGFYNIKAR